jgi:hypothetical protein
MMQRVRRRRTMFIALVVIAVLSSVSATTILAASHATTIRTGDLVIQADGAISPKALPKNKLAPVSLHASGSVATVDGSHVPPAQNVQLQVDRHIRIDTVGLPSCTLGKLTNTVPSQAMKACGKALMGKGIASAQVEFPDSAPLNAKGPLLGFNGPRVGGYSEMLYYVFVHVPVPTTLVVVAKVSKDSGKYAYRVSPTIPELAGGSRSLTGFDITIDRKWTYKGQQHSYLNAECPDGYFFYKIEAVFGDGTNLNGSLVNKCLSKG